MQVGLKKRFSTKLRWQTPPSRPSEPSSTPPSTFSKDQVSLSGAAYQEPKPSVVKQTGMGFMAALSLAGAVVGLAGCTPPPPSEVPEQSWSAEASYLYMSAEQEAELGKSVVRHVESETPVWNNAQAQARVDRLAARLVPHSIRDDVDYTFKLLDTDMVNAFAAPGGHIYITRGLYNRFEKDEHLLFIMGHEMGHVEQRHSVAQMGKSTLIDLAVRVTTEHGDHGETLGRVAEGIANSQISQHDEHESDRMGQAHLIQMGINPWHAVDAMKLLVEGTENMEPEIVTEIFGSHPPSQERVEELSRGAEGYPPL